MNKQIEAKIIDVIAKNVGLGPYHRPENAPLLEKIGFKTRIQKTKPRNTKSTIWIKLDYFCNIIDAFDKKQLPLYIGIEKETLNKILTLHHLPVPENWEQICRDHWRKQESQTL